MWNLQINFDVPDKRAWKVAKFWSRCSKEKLWRVSYCRIQMLHGGFHFTYHLRNTKNGIPQMVVKRSKSYLIISPAFSLSSPFGCLQLRFYCFFSGLQQNVSQVSGVFESHTGRRFRKSLKLKSIRWPGSYVNTKSFASKTSTSAFSDALF